MRRQDADTVLSPAVPKGLERRCHGKRPWPGRWAWRGPGARAALRLTRGFLLTSCLLLSSLCFSLCFQGERGMPGLPGRHGSKVPREQQGRLSAWSHPHLSTVPDARASPGFVCVSVSQWLSSAEFFLLLNCKIQGLIYEGDGGEEAFYKANGMPSPMLSCNIRMLMLYASESGQLPTLIGNRCFVNWGFQRCVVGRVAQV